MNSKKEVLAVSILAIGLAVGLWTLSFGLFSETPTPTKLESALDVYTQKGGIGVNISDGDYEPFDNFSIYAYLTQGGVKLQNRPVTFTIRKPDEAQITKTVTTNDLGFAEISIFLLPSEGHVIGTWNIVANTTVDNEAVKDTLSFQCNSQNARINVSCEKNGVPSFSFLPNDLVSIEAQLSYKNASIAGIPVAFEVKSPNGTEFLTQNVTTDSLGTANVTVNIPWPSAFSLGTWQISVVSEVYGQPVEAATVFECDLAPQVIDVFTQKGGVGQNTLGGHFVLNETVFLYAEVRDEFNQTMPHQLVTFVITDPSGNLYSPGAYETNSSGIAAMTEPIRIPSDVAYVGTFEVIAKTRYNGIVLLDTLTFTVTQN